MENNNNKIMTVCFILAGILAGVTISVLMNTLATIGTGGFGRFVQQDFVLHGLPIVVGFGTFLFLQLSKSVLAWADDVVTEIRRVVWPTRKDTTAMTVVVCIMLIISGIVFGIMDIASSTVVDWLLQHNLAGVLS